MHRSLLFDMLLAMGAWGAACLGALAFLTSMTGWAIGRWRVLSSIRWTISAHMDDR